MNSVLAQATQWFKGGETLSEKHNKTKKPYSLLCHIHPRPFFNFLVCTKHNLILTNMWNSNSDSLVFHSNAVLSSTHWSTFPFIPTACRRDQLAFVVSSKTTLLVFYIHSLHLSWPIYVSGPASHNTQGTLTSLTQAACTLRLGISLMSDPYVKQD